MWACACNNLTPIVSWAFTSTSCVLATVIAHIVRKGEKNKFPNRRRERAKIPYAQKGFRWQQMNHEPQGRWRFRISDHRGVHDRCKVGPFFQNPYDKFEFASALKKKRKKKTNRLTRGMASPKTWEMKRTEVKAASRSDKNIVKNEGWVGVVIGACSRGNQTCGPRSYLLDSTAVTRHSFFRSHQCHISEITTHKQGWRPGISEA